jgi:DNA invertase Pin-like site-specific DNA recombinase
MNVVIYTRVSSQSQENERQIIDLKNKAEEKGWTVKKVFQEKISGTVDSIKRPVFNSMVEYLDKYNIKIVMVAEVSRIGRRVLDVLSTVNDLHKKQVGVYIKPYDILTFHEGKEDNNAKIILQMFSMGAEMENDLRRQRQKEGIQLAKLKGKYTGRQKGAKADPAKILEKYKDVVDLIKKSDLSLRRISSITEHSINTVRKVAALVDC